MFRIEFDTDNDAFADDPRTEIVQILLKVVDDIHVGRSAGIIRDTNGNRIGEWTDDAD